MKVNRKIRPTSISDLNNASTPSRLEFNLDFDSINNIRDYFRQSARWVWVYMELKWLFSSFSSVGSILLYSFFFESGMEKQKKTHFHLISKSSLSRVLFMAWISSRARDRRLIRNYLMRFHAPSSPFSAVNIVAFSLLSPKIMKMRSGVGESEWVYDESAANRALSNRAREGNLIKIQHFRYSKREQ